MNMYTVKQWRDIGVEFVKGDVVTGISCGEYDSESINVGAYGNMDVTEFTPRKNTGAQPVPDGVMVDIELFGLGLFVSYESKLVNWGCKDISSWKPSLTQPLIDNKENKMSEQSEIHKAWVALKGDICNTHLYDGRVDLYLYLHNKDGYVCHHSLTFKNAVMVCSVKEFTDYCEMMKEKRMDIIGQNCNDGLHYDNTAQQVETLATDIEPVFTQETYNNLVGRIMQFNRCIGQIADYLRVSTSGVDVSGDDTTISATAEDIINGIKKFVNYDKHPDMDWMPSRDSECLFSYGGSEWKSCKYIGKSTVGSKCYAVLFVHESACYDNLKFCSELKFKPIQSPREKAIEEMLMTAINSDDDIAKSIIYEACVKLANANYRKLTPEQAKMYDDNTGFFGEQVA